ncbi:MAG: hypothetical protein QXL01_00255 [Thermoplasmatales archaeon]
MKKKIIKRGDLAQARHMKFLDKLEAQAILGFRFLMDNLLKEVKKNLKKEKLAKSDDDFTKLPSGWTGEVPTINIDLEEMLNKILDKHMKALEWILLGGYADKDAIKAAKDIGLTKIMIPGVTPSAYLQSLDTHRQHHEMVTGEEAPEIPNNIIKISFDQIKNRCVRVAEEFGTKFKNRILDSLEQIIKQKNFDNLNAAHKEVIDKLPVDGAQSALESVAEELDDNLQLREVTKAINEVAEKMESDWSRTVKQESAMSSAVGTHQSILEIYGNDNDDVTVIIEGFYDSKICDFCLNASKKPDGSFKKYKMKDFKASGYNMNKKKSNWELCIAPFHYNCFVADMDVLTNEGWKQWPSVTGKEKFLSVNLETGNAEWVDATKLIIQHYHGPIDWFSSRNCDIATTPNHNHVIRFRKKQHGRADSDNWKLVPGNELPNHDFNFLATIPSWQGEHATTITVADTIFNSSQFMKFLGIYMSEGNTSMVRGNYQIKISQKKFYNEFLEIAKTLFDKIWAGRDAFYIPLTDNPKLGKWFADLGKSNEKFIPEHLKSLSRPLLEDFLLYYRMGDGSLRNNKILSRQKKHSTSELFFTSSDKLSADIGELLLKCGYRPSYSKLDAKIIKHKNGTYTIKHPCWVIRKSLSGSYSKQNTIKENMHYNGLVYDVELKKNHTLIVRRNGRVTVSGNCRCTLIYVPRGFDVDNNGNFISKT